MFFASPENIQSSQSQTIKHLSLKEQSDLPHWLAVPQRAEPPGAPEQRKWLSLHTFTSPWEKCLFPFPMGKLRAFALAQLHLHHCQISAWPKTCLAGNSTGICDVLWYVSDWQADTLLGMLMDLPKWDKPWVLQITACHPVQKAQWLPSTNRMVIKHTFSHSLSCTKAVVWHLGPISHEDSGRWAGGFLPSRAVPWGDGGRKRITNCCSACMEGGRRKS